LQIEEAKSSHCGIRDYMKAVHSDSPQFQPYYPHTS